MASRDGLGFRGVSIDARLSSRRNLRPDIPNAKSGVPSNIAEGKGRFSNKELVHFLFNARGSLLDLETQVILATRLGYLSPERSENLKRMVADTAKMLNGLVNSFKAAQSGDLRSAPSDRST